MCSVHMSSLPFTFYLKNERTLACRKWTKWASTEAGLRGWPRLFQVGHEPDVQRREDENETEELMEQPEGTQEHGI
jgi:hypothetical protein